MYEGISSFHNTLLKPTFTKLWSLQFYQKSPYQLFIRRAGRPFMTKSLVNTSFMEYVPAYNFPCANLPIIECHQTHSALRRAICIFDVIQYGLRVANTVGGLSSKICYILLKKLLLLSFLAPHHWFS